MEVEKVYALYGRANSGKSSTLNVLIDLLGKTAYKIKTVKEIDDVDRLAVFKLNGKVVGVVTQGDYLNQVENGLNKIANQCNIIFCTTRTGGGTCTHVEDRFGDKLIWVHMPYIENVKIENNTKKLYESYNSRFAEVLFNLVEAADG